MEGEREEDIVSDMGCHFTWPEMKRIDRMDLDTEHKVLEGESTDFKSLPTRTISMINLLGFIEYSLNEQQKGINRFENVLKMDPSNVNALSCLAIIHRRHGLLSTYQEYASRLQRVLCANNPRTLARAFADRAFATKQFQQHERRFTYMPYLVKAVEKGKRMPDDLEKAEWHYEYALCLARRDAQHVMCKASPSQIDSVVRDAVLSFYKVTQLTDKDHPYLALAWANLGNILQRLQSRTFESILPSETSLHGMTAHDCFSKALSVSADNPDVLGIVGAAYAKECRHKEALDLLHRSLQLQQTQNAHRCCGLIYMQMWKMKKGDSNYSKALESFSDCTVDGVQADEKKNRVDQNGLSKNVSQLRVQIHNYDELGRVDAAIASKITETAESADTNNQDRDEESDTEPTDSGWEQLSLEQTLLFQAKDSFTKAIHINATHADHSDLGFVLHLLGDHHQSIQHYSVAVRCQDGDDFDTSQTHDRWAECLETLKETQGARTQRDIQRQIKASMREQSPDESWRYTHGVNCQGFECDISRFNYCAEERLGFVNVLSEHNTTPVNTNVGFFPTYTREFKYDFFISFAHIDSMWAVAFVYKLEKDFPGIRGRLRYRDYELGAAIADNIVNSVETSHRTLVILSPDSLRDRWCRYEVQRAHMMNLTRPCAIPIMLRACVIPREIEHLSVVKCDQGQIKTDDWCRLGKSLRQSEVDY
ncbi:uncharacterized protein [Amphiura filiformis]|uniref:uncharacterized protein n=1 Tax=Amphiura filiformis TaxID=82378 RepID=UPI003B219CCB